MPKRLLCLVGSLCLWAVHAVADEPVFLAACRSGDMAQVSSYLQSGHDINRMWASRNSRLPVTGLMVAVAEQQAEIVNYLLARNADPNKTNISGLTALHLAVQRGDLNITQALLNAGANLNAVRTGAITPLLDALYHGKPDCVLTLIEGGAEFSASASGVTALFLASAQGLVDIVRTLLLRGEKACIGNGNGEIPLHIAAKNNHAEVLAELLGSARVGLNKQTRQRKTPLMEAAAAGSLEAVQCLLKHGADLKMRDQAGETALVKAVKGGHQAIVEALLPDSLAVLQWFNNRGHTPLHSAAIEGNGPIVERLIAAGCQVNQPDGKGFMPIHYAAALGHLEVVQILQSRAAYIDSPGWGNYTPLHLASASGHEHIVSFLLQHHADPETIPVSGYSALHESSRRGYSGIVGRLLTSGARADRRFAKNETSLYAAARHGHAGVVSRLLLAEARPNIKKAINPFVSRSPAEAAIAYGHQNVLQKLSNSNAAMDSIGVWAGLSRRLKGMRITSAADAPLQPIEFRRLPVWNHAEDTSRPRSCQ